MKNNKSTIYLLCCESKYGILYKIGFTKNSTPDKRIKQLKTGNPDIQLITYFNTDHNRKIETYLHNLYKYERVNGEWFALEDDEVFSFTTMCEKIENNLNVLKEANNPFY